MARWLWVSHTDFVLQLPRLLGGTHWSHWAWNIPSLPSAAGPLTLSVLSPVSSRSSSSEYFHVCCNFQLSFLFNFSDHSVAMSLGDYYNICLYSICTRTYSAEAAKTSNGKGGQATCSHVDRAFSIYPLHNNICARAVHLHFCWAHMNFYKFQGVQRMPW